MPFQLCVHIYKDYMYVHVPIHAYTVFVAIVMHTYCTVVLGISTGS